MAGLPVDHLVYATSDVAATVRDVGERFGVEPALGGKHVGLGTYNYLLSLSEGVGPYLEIIGPDPDQPKPDNPLPFGIDALDGARLVGFAVTCSDLPGVVARARSMGYDPGEPADMSRATPEGPVLHWKLTLGPGFDGAVPFLIDWLETPHPSTTNPRGCTLVSLRVEHPDEAGVRNALAGLGVESVQVAAGPAPALQATIDTPKGRRTLQ